MFETHRSNLILLEGEIQAGRTIKAEDIVESMCMLYRDAFRASDNNYVPADDIVSFGYNLMRLFTLVKRSYNPIAAELLALSDKDIQRVISELATTEAQLNQLQPTIESLHEQQTALIGKKKAYDAAIEEQKRLTADISLLGAISPETVEQANKKLAEELANKARLSEDLKKAEGDCIKATSHNAKKEAEVQALQATKAKIDEETKHLCETESQLKAFIATFEDTRSKREQRLAENADMLTAIANAWHSACQRGNDHQIASIIGEISDPNLEAHTPDDLKQWMENLETGIEKALNLYCDIYKQISALLNSGN